MAVYTVDPFDAQMPFPLDLRSQRADINGRDSIPTNSRWQGMMCYVVGQNAVYMLVGGTSNANWQQVWPATGTGSNVTWSTNAPAANQGVDKDLWFRDNAGTGNIDLYYKQSGGWGLLGSWAKAGGSSSGQKVSLIESSSDVTITWQADTAPNEAGQPSGETYAQRFGNTPHFQVWMDTGAGYSLEQVPVTITMSGANIGSVNIQLSGINSRIIIK